jgi:hypothetical protein
MVWWCGAQDAEAGARRSEIEWGPYAEEHDRNLEAVLEGYEEMMKQGEEHQQQGSAVQEEYVVIWNRLLEMVPTASQVNTRSLPDYLDEICPQEWH